MGHDIKVAEYKQIIVRIAGRGVVNSPIMEAMKPDLNTLEDFCRYGKNTNTSIRNP